MMSTQRDIFSLYDNSPDRLFDLCMDYIVVNLNIITELDPASRWRKLKDDIILPGEICEKFLQYYQRKNRVNDNIANVFRDTENTTLRSIKLRNSRITDEGLRCLMAHRPVELELSQCDYLSQHQLEIINSNADRLLSLKFGPLNYTSDQPDERAKRGPYIEAPVLQHLTIQCRGVAMFPLFLLKKLNNLTHLDLSEYSSSGSAWVLYEMKNLRSLVLHCVPWSKEVIEWICTQRQLRHLDISQANERFGKYVNPNETLARIIQSLPNLESLDISGTNLAGSGAATVPALTENPTDVEMHVRCDIPGLVSRVNNPLEFLGLYGTHHGACKRHDIPAKVITGDANEEQILTAGAVYMERPSMLTRVLNDLYYLFRSTDRYNAYVGRALSVVLKAMEQHVSEKHIQISGSATLFYIVKGKEKQRMGMKLKRRIITALLDGMDAHLGDDTMMRNGCLTLCQFKIPVDVLFEYERVVHILLNGVADVNQESFVQRIAIYLLNSLACQVDGTQKRFLGSNGAISKMLNLISDRLERRVCDDVLEVAWSTMWNVTDETPQNCQRFLDNRGMEYFLACLKCFPDKEELLRNMMGLLGNVAEVPQLRPQLMDKLFLSVFYELLESSSDGIEVSYNAAGVLAHMASDGPEAWTVEEPARDAVLERIAAAVERWNLRVERNINYRSFEPILGLLSAHHTPQCQHWAVWALANLTTVYPEKYCSLVEAEGGIRLLYGLLNHPCSYNMIKELAWKVIENCQNHSLRGEAGEPPSLTPDN